MIKDIVWKLLWAAVPFITCAMTGLAFAQQLDSIFPDNMAPGFMISDLVPERPPIGVAYGGVSLVPAIKLNSGYDSSPSGSAASALGGIAPNVTLRDDALGLGAYGSLGYTIYPENSASNVTSYSLGVGDTARLPRETFVIAGGVFGGQQNAFTPGAVSGLRRISYSLQSLRVSDDVDAALFRLRPEISLNATRLAGFAPQDHDDQRIRLTGFYHRDSPVTYVLRADLSQSEFHNAALNADTGQILAGLQDAPNGLWTIQLLTGIAQRRPNQGGAIIVPVMELRLALKPSGLDVLRAIFTHEIDNPDDVTATPDILTEGQLTMTHDFSRDLSASVSGEAALAHFIASPNQESVFTTKVDLRWQMNARLATDLVYNFNDRQANFAPAANEHVMTAGVTWTP
ncbi:MAG: outer membrane beta-barrel protein [Acidocella sp.]|nr:outer membrane beta-barrel protein [Acidocella sp.]